MGTAHSNASCRASCHVWARCLCGSAAVSSSPAVLVRGVLVRDVRASRAVYESLSTAISDAISAAIVDAIFTCRR